MKIIFFGSSRFVIPLIEMLKQQFELVLVVTTESNTSDAVPAYCLEHNIKYLSISSFTDDVKSQLLTVNCEMAALAYFGLILPKDVLNIFPKGIINVHPSLLPLYRGPTPGQAALLSGDKETGITIIKLDEEVDHGPVLAQETEPVRSDDTAETLYERLFTKSAPLLGKSLNNYLKGKRILTEQDHTKATFTPHLERKSGYIDVQNPPTPEMLDRMIRAYYPWPGVWTEVRSKNKELRIKLLPNKMIQVEGKKPVSLKDFLNGYPELRTTIEPLLT